MSLILRSFKIYNYIPAYETDTKNRIKNPKVRSIFLPIGKFNTGENQVSVKVNIIDVICGMY